MTGDSDLAAGEGLFTGEARAGEGPGPEPPAGAPVEAEEAEGRGRGQGWAGSTGGLGGAAVWQGKQGSAPCPGPTGQLEAPAQRPLPSPAAQTDQRAHRGPQGHAHEPCLQKRGSPAGPQGHVRAPCKRCLHIWADVGFFFFFFLLFPAFSSNFLEFSIVETS